MKKYFLVLIQLGFLCFLLLSPTKTIANDGKPDGYLWEKLTPNEKFVYVFAYVEGISEMNLEWRHQMDVLRALYELEKNEENKYLAEYGKETKAFYEKHYHYFGIPYRQLIEGINDIYKDYKNKSIRLKDAFSLVRAELNGTDEKELERRKVYMRKSKEEQNRIIKNLMEDMDLSKTMPEKGTD